MERREREEGREGGIEGWKEEMKSGRRNKRKKKVIKEGKGAGERKEKGLEKGRGEESHKEERRKRERNLVEMLENLWWINMSEPTKLSTEALSFPPPTPYTLHMQCP